MFLNNFNEDLTLISLGYTTGSIEDRWCKYFTDEGYTGSLNDMMYAFLLSKGYSGTLNDMMSQFDGVFSADFDAADYGTPLLWFDAQDPDTITLVSTKVSNWESKGTLTLNAAQTVDARRPTYSATGFDGSLPVIDMIGSVGMLLDGDVSSIDAEYTVVYVVRNNTVDANQYWFDSFHNGNGDRFLINGQSSNTVRQYMSANTVNRTVTPSNHLLVFRLKEADSSLYVDGSLASSGDAYPLTQIKQPTGIGAEYTGYLRSMDGGFGEVIIYQGALSTDTIAALNTALIEKWDLS